MNFRVQKKHRIFDKSTQQNHHESTQQQAQLNLIQISNQDFIQEQHPQPDIPSKQQQERPAIKTRAKQPKIPLIRQYNRSTELRRSVAEKMTESFKAGRRASCSELHTDSVCIIKRKLPLSLSNFVVLGQETEPKPIVQPTSPLTYRPRPSISMRTYYRRKEEFKKEEFNWTQRPRYEALIGEFTGVRGELKRKQFFNIWSIFMRVFRTVILSAFKLHNNQNIEMSKALTNSLALLKQLKMQFSVTEPTSPLIPERTYGSIKRTNNAYRSKLLQDDANSLMSTIDSIFEQAQIQNWRNR